MNKTKHKAKPVTGDILDFHDDLTHLMVQYSKAGCCPGCMAERLVQTAVGLIIAAGGICWSSAHSEEVELIAELAKRVATRVVSRSVEVPPGETLQ